MIGTAATSGNRPQARPGGGPASLARPLPAFGAAANVGAANPTHIMKNVTRKAEADWNGNLDNGHGLVTTASGTLVKQPFSFSKRTEQGDSTQTNPEELIAAGLASCFGMALAMTLQHDGVTAQQIVVGAEITLTIDDDGPKVNRLNLDVAGMVEGFTQEQFENAVATTQKGCPIYKLLEPGLKTIDVKVSLNN